MKKPLVPVEQALALFTAAPDDALLHQDVVAAILAVPSATLEKARSVGDTDFPPFIKIGTRVRYRAATVRAHLAKLNERSVA
ncbi:MAG: hypothetical protein RLZZ129_32 [Verrucomicrobiota bacterium]